MHRLSFFIARIFGHLTAPFGAVFFSKFVSGRTIQCRPCLTLFQIDCQGSRSGLEFPPLSRPDF